MEGLNTKENEVRLPKRKEFEFNDESLKNNELEEGLLLQNIRDHIKNKLFFWDDETDKYFQFDLPPTIFTDKSSVRFIQDQNIDIEYNDNNRDLSPGQFQDIWTKGEFSINSKIENLPFIWKITSWLSYGTDNIKLDYFKQLCLSYYMLYIIGDRFCGEHISISNSICKLFICFRNGLDLFLGLPNKYLFNEEDKIQKKLEYELYKTYLDNKDFDSNVYFKMTKELVNSDLDAFASIWEKEYIEYEQKLIDQKLSQQEIKNNMEKERLIRFKEYLSLQTHYSDKTKNLLIAFLDSIIVVENAIEETTDKTTESKNLITETIIKENYIRANSKRLLNDLVNSKMTKVSIDLKDSEKNNINKGLINYPLQQFMYKAKTNFNETLNEKVSAIIRERGNKYLPNDTFEVNRSLFPPYIIEKTNGQFYLRRYQTYKIQSSICLWRIALYFVRFYAWTINCLLFCLSISWKSGFGIKALFVYELYTDYALDNNTGRIYEINPTGSAVVSVYCDMEIAGG